MIIREKHNGRTDRIWVNISDISAIMEWIGRDDEDCQSVVIMKNGEKFYVVDRFDDLHDERLRIKSGKASAV
jgi:hypothetical protein